MHYEINVSFLGHHFFATHERSIRDSDKLRVVVKRLREAFPLEEGFHISVSRFELRSTDMNMNDINGED